jgi:hypothetical protein
VPLFPGVPTWKYQIYGEISASDKA